MKNKMLMIVMMALMPVVAMASDMRPAGGYYETRSASCDMAAMQNTLDNATADRRAVITVVKCNPRPAARTVVARPAAASAYVGDVCIDCVVPIERVVSRRTYVEETVQQYRPVVAYVPAGRYTRTRRVCNECDM
ncbi:hypothetical protein HDR61_02105 [bacterium]|nr:hypothetical protein [bacterium]